MQISNFNDNENNNDKNKNNKNNNNNSNNNNCNNNNNANCFDTTSPTMPPSSPPTLPRYPSSSPSYADILLSDYCHYDVNEHVNTVLLIESSKKNVPDLVQKMNVLLLQTNSMQRKKMALMEEKIRDLNKKLLELKHIEQEHAALQEKYRGITRDIYLVNKKHKQHKNRIKHRLMPSTRKDKVGRTGIYYRAQRHRDILDAYCDEADIEKMQKLQFLDDEYGIIADAKRKWEIEFAANTNRQFREFEADPERILTIAITKHGLGINHRQAKKFRIAQTKTMGERGRSISMFIDSGVKFGGGLVNDHEKYSSLCQCEKNINSEGIGVMPILHDTLEID